MACPPLGGVTLAGGCQKLGVPVKGLAATYGHWPLLPGQGLFRCHRGVAIGCQGRPPHQEHAGPILPLIHAARASCPSQRPRGNTKPEVSFAKMRQPRCIADTWLVGLQDEINHHPTPPPAWIARRRAQCEPRASCLGAEDRVSTQRVGRGFLAEEGRRNAGCGEGLRGAVGG